MMKDPPPSSPLPDEVDGGGARPALAMSAATSKRFKHEKTLVMLNPSLSGGEGVGRCGWGGQGACWAG